MVVRHPFERILSAYRDKLEDLSRDIEAREGYYYTMYGKHIVAEYRDPRDRANMTGVLEPSWREFVTYLLNTPATKYDEHWMPMWMLCSPCIIRLSWSNGEHFLVNLQNTFLDMTLFPRWRHSQKILSISYNKRVWRINFLLSGNIEQGFTKREGEVKVQVNFPPQHVFRK